MGLKFLQDITNLDNIQFINSSGTNAGLINMDGNDLVISNSQGDVLLGDGSADVFIGDGVNNVDIRFEQSGFITADNSSATLTIGGTGNLVLEEPTINGTATFSGNVAVSGTVDGRDVATDGTKLDGISTGADVTPSWVPSSDPNYLTSYTETNLFLGAGGSLTTAPGYNRLIYTGQISNGVSGLFAASDNSNSVITLNRHSGNYDSQLGFSSNGNVYYRKFSNTAINTTQGWGQLLISDTSGNVGIGTTSPDSLLHVSADVLSGGATNTGTITIEGRPAGYLGDDIATIDFHNTGVKYADIRMERGNAGNDSQLVFSTSDTGTLNDALIINEVGNVGIGTTSPGEKLDVAGNAIINGDLTVTSGTSGDATLIISADTDNSEEGDSPRLWFKADGDITQGAIQHNDNTFDFISNVSANGGFKFLTGTTNNTGTTDPSTGATERVSIDSTGMTISGSIQLGHASDTTIARASAGKVTIEGAPIQTTQMSMSHHNFFMNSTSTTIDFFIPFNSLNESSNPTNSIYYGRMVAPYDGRIVKVVLHTTAAIGTACQVLFWVATSSGTFAPSAAETVTGVDLNTANTSATATFSTTSTAEFDEGDVLGVSIIKSSSATANMQVTVVWEYTV